MADSNAESLGTLYNPGQYPPTDAGMPESPIYTQQVPRTIDENLGAYGYPDDDAPPQSKSAARWQAFALSITAATGIGVQLGSNDNKRYRIRVYTDADNTDIVYLAARPEEAYVGSPSALPLAANGATVIEAVGPVYVYTANSTPQAVYAIEEYRL